MPFQTTDQIDSQPASITSDRFPAIFDCIDRLCDDKTVTSIRDQINSAIDLNKPAALVSLYHQIIPIFERFIWSDTPGTTHIDLYQALFREMESLIALQPEDNRHHITIVIPVADRPGQLTDCINSLLLQCTQYKYGGRTGNQLNKISVIIADDSVDEECIEHNKSLCDRSNNNGLPTIYFGRDEQDRLINLLSIEQRNDLTSLLGDMNADKGKHKGPSVMRNLCYLYVNHTQQKPDNSLFYFIDSDQLFSINPDDSRSQAINYFYYLDRVFADGNAKILTGKVVGDPPVSPAVMANTLLADAISLLQQILQSQPDNPCQFHQANTINSEEATYHDMADLFGFRPDNKSIDYNCPLTGNHTNRSCLVDFCHRLNQFFHGEHPTRTSHYQYKNPIDSIAAARTVYTGNYAFKSDALSYFIPFSNLHLRMAGPTLGRILKSSLGDQFISANLPMLHKRTFGDTGKAECRPGVDMADNLIDLSQEYIRQYFGDVMLFSVEKLSALNYPEITPDEQFIRSIVHDIESDLYRKYHEKRQLVMEKISILKLLATKLDDNNDGISWLKSSDSTLDEFINNIEFNFGSKSAGFQHISDKTIKANRLNDIIIAISRYHTDLHNWNNTLYLSR